VEKSAAFEMSVLRVLVCFRKLFFLLMTLLDEVIGLLSDVP
jgi:hypothetical protein